jgi:hypothetical protein
MSITLPNGVAKWRWTMLGPTWTMSTSMRVPGMYHPWNWTD